jgi:DNA recombination protein RmuC
MTQFDLLAAAGVLLVGVVLGALGVWFVFRGREKPRIDAALAQAQATANVDLATANLRANQAENNLTMANAELSKAKAREAELNAALGAAGNQSAQLAERASRIPELERQLVEMRTLLDDANGALSNLRETSSSRAAQLSADLQAVTDSLAASTRLAGEERKKREEVEGASSRVGEELAGLKERYDAELRSAAEKLQLLTEAREVLSNQFKALANEIFEEKSKRFTDQNQTNLGQLLDPLRTKLTEFQNKVEEVYVQEGKDRSALAEQVKHLLELNNMLSTDAKNLTTALKGSAKTQGGWGEYILERVLEASGLQKGLHYVAQDAQVSADGKRQFPDVVIYLPEQRRLVVDAKVSLVAFERFVTAESDAEREIALKQHLDSVRGHVRSLSEKNYQHLYGIQSLDFVLMFVPVEPAFMLAVTSDQDLFMDAWQRNVILVSPSTLLFVVRTVAHLWRQEQQSRNAQDIAKRGAELYDRLCGFVEDLRRIGERLSDAQAAYTSAEKKLAQGKGNVIRQAEMLKELGVKPTKQIQQPLVDMSSNDDGTLVALRGTDST